MPDSTNSKQITIDISYEEQDLLNQAAILIAKAMDLKDNSSVRKYEYLHHHIGELKTLQLLQALGNIMYQGVWDNCLIESHKAAWKMEYRFKYPPT